MTPLANLQKRGKRDLEWSRGSARGRDRDGGHAGSPFPAGGPRPTAARHARWAAAAAVLSPAGGRGPVFHPRPTPTSGGHSRRSGRRFSSAVLATRAAPTITDSARSPPTSCKPDQSAGTLRRRPASRLQRLKDTARSLPLFPRVGEVMGPPRFLRSRINTLLKKANSVLGPRSSNPRLPAEGKDCFQIERPSLCRHLLTF